MKIFRWISDKILFFLFLITLFLLAFIPLYPKLPLVDVVNTWVYIRIEDFVVAFAVLFWIALIMLKKITLKTPLTLPIIIFWLIGGISTLHGVLLIFPTLPDAYSNVAFLSFLRRVEYMSLFFIAYQSMTNKRLIRYVVFLLAVILLLVVGYGFGQKFLGFPAFLTGNEEFAKGIPIRLSQLSRVPSTFGGHYDLAAYLVLIIPILTSLVFGFRNWLIKFLLLITASLGFGLLFMTVSRVSFFVLFLSLMLLLILQKKRLLIVCFFLISLVSLSFFPSLTQRFGSTVSEVNVLVNAKTGEAIGNVKEVPSSYFEDKVVLRELARSEQNPKLATTSAIVASWLIPPLAPLVVESNQITGENLPQGTSYINLPLSRVLKRTGEYFYQKSNDKKETATKVFLIYGDFLIKRAKAYDLSFTTRFQGEWPRTLTAFKRNIFLGDGYGSVSLAVDNNYLRILGESGLLGFISFFSILIISFIYIKKILPKVDSKVVKSFVLGFIAGTFGLLLNAIFIDVFEASKIAFTFWLLLGITIGILHLYKTEEINLFKDFRKIISSTNAVIVYLFIFTIVLYYPFSSYYFVGDDFTWFRWVSDCCNNILNYFTNSNGFFYRPGTKIYFSIMHSSFWLNQTVYHLASLILHFLVATLVFLISKRVSKNHFLSAVSAVVFLILPGYSEAVFWISSTGFLFNAMFALLSLLLFIYWREKGKAIYFILSILSIISSLLFHELGVIVPLLVILYDIVFGERLSFDKLAKKAYYVILLFPIFPYLLLRYLAHSHWFNGDYSYNLLFLPYNFVGNIIGYLLLDAFGPSSLSFYEALRIFTREHIAFAILVSIIIIFLGIVLLRFFVKKTEREDRKIVIFAFLFFAISLLPFLGLGNITSRYSYLSSFGFVLLLVFFLKKIYGFLLTNGRHIAIVSILGISIVFLMAHLFQLQKIHSDWQAAGEKSKNFLISLNELYTENWSKDHMQFYFINVPIRNGDAWVFPVGLSDAVWFISMNKDINVYQMSSLSEAFDTAQDPINDKVFEFEGDGGVIQRIKPQKK